MLLSLAGCGVKPDIIKDAEVLSAPEQLGFKQQQLESLEIWEIDGRLGLKTSDDAWSASLLWQQNRDDLRMRIIAPFHGTYEVKRQGDVFSLLTPKGEFIETKTPEAVMQDNVGWFMPVRSLKYWIKGIPDPELELSHVERDAKANLITLNQGDWALTFANYQDISPYTLPGKIILTNQNAKITVLIKQWKIIR